MNLYDENNNLLRTKYNINLISESFDVENYKIVKNENDMCIGMIKKDGNSFYVDYEDSRIDDFIKNITPNQRTFILIGFGLGNCVKKILSNIGNNNLIVLENDTQMLNYAIAVSDLSNVFNKENVKLEICHDYRTIKEAMEKNTKDVFFSQALDVIICPGYREVYSEFTNNALECIKKVFNNSVVNKSTMQAMSYDILKTLFNNIPYIVKSNYINNLKNIFIGKTAVVVSSGPSLSKNLHLLKKYNDKVIIITAERNLNYMASEGIVPHLVCTIDPGDLIYDITKDSFNKGLFFISTEHANNKTMKNIYESNMFCTVLFQELISKITEKQYEKFPSISSVAHLSTIVAVYMGCKNVIFIGQDLAYTNNQSHDNFSLRKWGGINLKDRNDLFYVEGNYGDKVLTDLGFENFKQWLEDYIAMNNGVSFINCTEGGAKINGTRIAELKETLEQLCNNKDNMNASKLLKNTFSKEIKFDKFRIIYQVMKLEEEIRLIKSKYEQGIELCKSIYEFNKGNMKIDINKVVQDFSEIDKISEGKTYINSLINIIALVPLKRIMQDIDLIESLEDNPKQRGIKYAKRNKAVCNLYVESMNKILELIHECIEKLKDVL